MFCAGEVLSQSTAILIGGEDTELSPDGVITGRGSSQFGGLGAALLDTFNIYYQPLGEGEFQDNLFPDPEVYSFQMDIPGGLPNYQSQGIHGSFWDSRGRDGEGALPWINRDWREGQYYDAQYRPAGEESPYGLVTDEVQWTIDYWDVDGDDEICFIHTCLSGMVEDFRYNEDTGDATALLVTLQTAYLGYGDDGEPGPGVVEYDGGAYQGFDSFRERSGLLDYPAYFFQYDGETNEGSLTPCGTKVVVSGEDGVRGYFDTIQGAIDASESGDTVLVQPGTYFENINTEGKGDITIGSLTLTTGDPDYIETTILDGGGEGPVVSLSRMQRDVTVTLQGFTIRNGNADLGGGVVATGSIYANLIDLNVTENQGRNIAGIAAYSIWDVHLRRVSINNNDGTGIWISAMRTSVEDCEISNNQGIGGNIGAQELSLTNVAFLDNEMYGLMVSPVSRALLDHLTIVGTRMINDGNGDGLYIGATSGNQVAVVLNNSIIYANEGDAIILHEGGGESELSLSVRYSDVESGEDGVVLPEMEKQSWIGKEAT